VAITKIEPDFVFGRLGKSMGFEQIVMDLAGKRRSTFDLEREIYFMVLHRLLASGSGRAAEAWKVVERMIRSLDNLQQVEVLLQGRRFFLRGEIKVHASQSIRAAEVALPPVLQELIL